MENCFFIVPEHKVKNLAQGIHGGPVGDADLESPQNVHRGRGYKVPNGGLYSTPTDMAKFLICNFGYSNILDPKFLEMMHAKQTPEAGCHCDGLGLEMYQDPKVAVSLAIPPILDLKRIDRISMHILRSATAYEVHPTTEKLSALTARTAFAFVS